MEKLITYIGLDVHKNTIAVAVAEAGPRKEVRDHGTIANTPATLKKLIAKLASSGHELRFCYEAGPCGYGIQRQIAAAGHECTVVAPSLIPNLSAQNNKTARVGPDGSASVLEQQIKLVAGGHCHLYRTRLDALSRR